MTPYIITYDLTKPGGNYDEWELQGLHQECHGRFVCDHQWMASIS